MFLFIKNKDLTGGMVHTKSWHQPILWNSVLCGNLEGLWWLRNSLPFMEPDGLLPDSQKPTTGPYLKSREYSLCPPSSFFKIIIILSSHLGCGLPSSLFASGFQHILLVTNCTPISADMMPSCMETPVPNWWLSCPFLSKCTILC